MSKEPEQDRTVTLYHCTNGVMVGYGGDLDFVEDGCLDEVAKLHGDDIWFLEFIDVTAAMLVPLMKSPFIQEAIEWLRSRSSGGRQYSHSKLIAMEAALKLDAIDRRKRVLRLA